MARFLLALTLLLALAASALAGGHDEFVVDGVTVRADCPWPDVMSKGWFPVLVELENGGERERDVRLVLRQGSSTVTQDVRVGAGAKAEVELVAPLSTYAWGQWTLLASSGSERRASRTQFGANALNPKRHAVLFLSRDAAVAGDPERWSAQVSTVRVADTSEEGLVIVRSAVRVAPSTDPDDIAIAAARFAQMPHAGEAYSSLDLVVLDTTRGLPEPAQLEPLLAWVELGGALAIFGPGADARAREIRGLAPWLEQRFLLGSFEEDVRTYTCGLGTCFVGVAEREFPSGGQLGAMRWACAGKIGWVPDADLSQSRLGAITVAIPGLGELPYKGFAALLLVFAALIGPVNFWLVKRRGKPALLLLTIPSIALAFSLVLFAWGIFHQGLDVKTASWSWTALDQREHRAATVEKRELYAGLSPGAGLRPSAGTSCYLVARTTSPWQGLERMDGPVSVDRTDGVLLSGAFLPARTPVLQQIHSERAARARLEIARDGEGWSVVNGLEARVDKLLLRDAAGAYHTSAAAIEPGARARLERVNATEAQSLARSLFHVERVNEWNGLPLATYAAQIARGAFGDDCGIETHEKAGAHYVWGILPLEGEPWR